MSKGAIDDRPAVSPRRILTVGGNPATQAFYESLGIDCVTPPASEPAKAAGAIGCLTAVVQRVLL